MLKGEVKYPSTTHAWPYSDINTVREIASFLGVAVDAQTTSLMTGGYMIPLPAQYKIRTDFRTILEIFVMLDDPDLTDADKTEALLRMLYVRREASPEGNRPEDPTAALQAFTDFVDPRQAAKTPATHSTRLIDWSQDFDLMVAPINHILGFECRAADYLHWRTFLAAYLEIPPESVFARVLRIREKLRTGKKLEKYERTWYNKNRDLVHLKPKFSKAEEAILSEWA